MGTGQRERLRDRARELLDFEPAERVPCGQVLGIGLIEEVCENDESLKRWLVCQAVEFAIDEDRDVEDALAEAFDMAEDQCEFFALDRPEDRQTSFGPLEAQVERQQRLGGGRPGAARSGRGGAAESVEPDQARLGDRPSRLGEFGDGEDG